MQTLIQLIIESGRTGVDLSLYLILPVMVIMMSLMKVLDEKGFLNWLAALFAPVLIIFGLPGLGILALLQILFVSFAAPVAILRIMDQNPNITNAQIAATFSAVLVMSQANASFPLAAVGLNLPVTILTSLVCGLLAGITAWKIVNKTEPAAGIITDPEQGLPPKEKSNIGIIPLLFKGGEEGLQIVIKTMPALIIAVFMVNIFSLFGIVAVLEQAMSPFLITIGIPGIAVLPIVTKFIAGGTAMMAILLDLMNSGLLTEAELNRVAGFTLHPLDPVGLAVFLAAGPRLIAVVKPAVAAALIAILIKGIIHLLIF